MVVLHHHLPRPSNSRDKRKRTDDSDTEDDDGERPRIVLHIRKSLLGAAGSSKPPKKVARARKGIEKCNHCNEGLSALDKKSKNLFVDCGDHRVHKYCQEECLEENH